MKLQLIAILITLLFTQVSVAENSCSNLFEETKSEFLNKRRQIEAPQMATVLTKAISHLQTTAKILQTELIDINNSIYGNSRYLANNLDYVLQKLNEHIHFGQKLAKNNRSSYQDIHFYLYKTSFYLSFLSSKELSEIIDVKNPKDLNLQLLELATRAVLSFNHSIAATNQNILRAEKIFPNDYNELRMMWQNYLEVLELPFINTTYDFGIIPLKKLNSDTASGIKTLSLAFKLEDYDGLKKQLPFRVTEHDINHTIESGPAYDKLIHNLSFSAQLRETKKIFKNLVFILNDIRKEQDPLVQEYLEIIFFHLTHEGGVDISALKRPDAVQALFNPDGLRYETRYTEIMESLVFENLNYDREKFQSALKKYQQILEKIKLETQFPQ